MTVAIVGAGPGDPGLITVRGLELVEAAEVLVYDRLVSAELVAKACDAELVARDELTQRQVNDVLVREGRRGRAVVRLKGGDPFVFGRGGEEALALVAAGIRFRIVPGISAGIGGLAYAGIPLTHRETNSAVTLVTGHSVEGTVPGGLDWEAIGRGSPVIVLYMGLKHLRPIAARLIAAGRDPAEPAAVVSRVATEAQRVVVATLSEITEAAEGMETPAIVVIGEVVRLRDRLDWLAL
jgi:uroporphyrin-III C-methyltransferase